MESSKPEKKSATNLEGSDASTGTTNSSLWLYVLGAAILILGLIALFQYSDIFGNNDDPFGNNTDGNRIERFSYNGHNFVKNKIGQYTTALPGLTLPDGSPYVVYFRNTPMEVEYIDVEGNFSDFLPTNETYITLDIGNVEGNTDMLKSVSNLALSMASAFYPIQGNKLMNPQIVCNQDNDPSCAYSQIITCEDNPDKKVVEMIYGEEDRIFAQGNCVKLIAQEGNMNKVVDRLFYDWYGIIDRDSESNDDLNGNATAE